MVDKYAHKAPNKRRKPSGSLKRWKMCVGKLSYGTEKEAEKAQRGEVTRAYKCPHCGRYHNTKARKQDV